MNNMIFSNTNLPITQELNTARSFIDILEYRAKLQANEVLFKFLQDGEIIGEQITYKELQQQAQQLGQYLRKKTKPNNRVLLMYHAGLDFITVFFACMYASVIAVPTYVPKRKPHFDDIGRIIDDADTNVILTNDKAIDALTQGFEKYSNHQLDIIATNNIPKVAQSTMSHVNLTYDSIAFLQYTSGSTGNPKGVMVTQGNLLDNMHRIEALFEHSKRTRFVSWLPHYHDMGLIGCILHPLYLGIEAILMSPVSFLQKPIRWLGAISKYKATTSGGPNFSYDLCVERITNEQLKQLDLSSWDVAFNGSEPVRSSTIKNFADKFSICGFKSEAAYPCYGQAEATLLIAGSTKSEVPVIHGLEQNPQKNKPAITHFVSSGNAIDKHEIVIVNPETLTQVKDGQIGEIWLSNGSIAKGYWNNSEETKKNFYNLLPGGKRSYLRSGDLGFIFDQKLYVTGRLKDMIIIRGSNYYPQDIEHVVQHCHPALRNNCGAAFSIDFNGIEKIVVVQELKRTAVRNADFEAIFSAINKAVFQKFEQKLYAIQLLKPSYLPKTTSGKIKRKDAKKTFLDGSLESIKIWYRNQEEFENLLKNTINTDFNDYNSKITIVDNTQYQNTVNWLMATLIDRLELPQNAINIHTPFSDMGIDSAMAASIAHELSEYLNDDISAAIFWHHDNINALCCHLANQNTQHKPRANNNENQYAK